MDWYLPADDAASVTALRHEIREHLLRHSVPGTDVADAELVVQELLANAFEHAQGPAWVHLAWAAEQPVLVVRDLGHGFALPQTEGGDGQGPVVDTAGQPPALDGEGGRGLFLVAHLAADLEVAARRDGGTEVRAVLPVQRAASRTIDPPAPPTQALPGLDEASPSGGFEREVFLRALVVQLSQAVEQAAGPDVGEDVVAQVGIAVGGQMEAEYRAAREVVGRLTPQQLAECFVRLKHAIDGGFFVVEVTDDRIVLGNTRCPFGEAVRKAPALCRMTSSVFGGIAARNADDGAAVVLEERIAVGDSGCRVVVHLSETAPQVQRFAHRYRSPLAAVPTSQDGGIGP